MIFTRDEVQAGEIRRVTVRLGDKHKGVLGYVYRGAIRPVVYAALSKGVVDGHLGAPDQGVAGAAGGQHRVANQRDGDYGLSLRGLGFSPEDEIAIVFCSSKKSLPSGVRWPSCCSRGDSRPDRLAADVVSPDPTNGMCVAGAPLRREAGDAPAGRAGAAGRCRNI